MCVGHNNTQGTDDDKQDNIVLCYLSSLTSSVSCVWLFPTHIALCYLSCLSSSVSCVWLMCAGQNHTQETGRRRQTAKITQHYMCWTQPYTRYTRRQTSQITQYYLSCISSSCVLCMVVSNIYSVVLFVFFVVVQSLVYYICWTQPCTRHRTTTNKTNNTTLCVFDTTMHKTQDDDKQDK
jgi:hypothetical protein